MNPSQAARRLATMRLRGTWRPGAQNVIMLIAQVVILWTAAQRGLDYFNLPDLAHGHLSEGSVNTLRGIEMDIPLRVLGLSFLLPAGAAFFGLTTGWAKPLSLGHLFIGASYLVLGITFLRDTPVDSWPQAVTGCVLLVLAALLLVTHYRFLPDLAAFLLGLGAMAVGGWLASHGMGYGYRTGNGFLGAAALHFAFGFGTQVLARREERLKREEEEDLQALVLR
jgi:hypothetical protein